MKTDVSIIIPFYENINLLHKAINSVFNQSFKNYEIIVIHDNPKKKSSKFFRSLKYKKKIRIIYNRKNLGAGLSRNKGIAISRGKYIAFLDSDDEWSIHKLSKQINFMKKNKYLASHTSYDRVDISGRYLSTRYATNLNYKNLMKSCDIGLSTVIISKHLLKTGHLFPSIKTKEDYVLWLKISRSGTNFYAIKSRLTRWRNTPNSLSNSVFQKLKDSFIVYHKYENLNYIKSIFRILILSYNYLVK